LRKRSYGELVCKVEGKGHFHRDVIEQGEAMSGLEGSTMEAPLLRVHEAARLLKVSKWTIYRWIEEGRLEATKIGRGSLRVFRASVNGLIDENRIDMRDVLTELRGRVVPLKRVSARDKT
jgi:excisionase family DNA binding protein